MSKEIIHTASKKLREKMIKQTAMDITAKELTALAIKQSKAAHRAYEKVWRAIGKECCGLDDEHHHTYEACTGAIRREKL